MHILLAVLSFASYSLKQLQRNIKKDLEDSTTGILFKKSLYDSMKIEESGYVIITFFKFGYVPAADNSVIGNKLEYEMKTNKNLQPGKDSFYYYINAYISLKFSNYNGGKLMQHRAWS
uniref:Uncharacterized protein n=1 Tax=Strigamia maritima TaxID=126957 RepID=T1J6T5_STRMM